MADDYEMGVGNRMFCGLTSLVYVASGAMKLFPVSASVATHMEKSFATYAQVFPLKPIGYIPDPAVYQRAVGIIELSLGLVLLAGSPLRCKQYACAGLMIIMAGAAQTLLFSGETVMVACPVLFFFALLRMHRLFGRKRKDE